MTRAAAGLALALALLLASPAAAQQGSTTVAPQPVMLVVDISGSMDDDDGAGTRKIDGAKLALLDYIGSVESDARVGLWTYPRGGSSSCDGGSLPSIEIGTVDPEKMSATIRSLEPDGDTPTAEAMRAAVTHLKDSRATRGTLVIVSDGESTCGDPCEAAREIAGEGFELDTITVGFQISEAGREQLECISDALDGRYLDIEESAELRDTLDRLGRPRVEVKLASSALKAVAGGDYVDVKATVTNTGEVEARDVVAQLYLGPKGSSVRTAGFDVRRPVAHLGNLAASASQDVVWRIRADASAAGKSTEFTAGGRAVNASAAGEASGRIDAVGVKDASQAGAILTGPGKGIAILGDSYSAGEGSGRYESGTDTAGNGCHRSLLTYLVPQFGKENVLRLACSGAVTAQVWGPGGFGEASQTSRLAELQRSRGPVSALVMTIGGNDAGFGMLAKSCLAGANACTARVYTGLPLNPFSYLSRGDFDRDKIGDDSGLRESLKSTYQQVNQALNNEAAVKQRGSAAPMLVLGYPLPVPLLERACGPMGVFHVLTRAFYLLTGEEIESVIKYALRLNATAESAVEELRRDKGVPVFYVPATEFALLPRHTVCDSGRAESATEPFAVSLDGVTLKGVDARTILEFVVPATRLHAMKTIGERTVQQIAHPNAKGYEAESYAILRWSQSRAAQDAVKLTATAKAATSAPTSWRSSEVILGQFVGGSSTTVQGGTAYPLQGGGFAPDASVQIVVRSTPRVLAIVDADSEGLVRTRVAIPPDLEAGKHTIELTGTDADGRARTVRIPIDVDGSFRPPVQAAMAIGSGMSLLLGLGLLAATGRLRRWSRRLRGLDD